MDRRLIGIYDTRAEAEAAREDLLSAGFSQGQIDMAYPDTTETGGESFWDKIKDFFGAEDRELYQEASRRGQFLLTIDASEDEVDRAVGILQRHNPADIEQKAQEWGVGKSEESIPVVEEQMKVGKHAETRGGVRIFSRVTETPVEEDIRLREERVHVERQSVDRPASEADFREETIEATETREEPVVSKEARVVEEVTLGKDVEERTETVKGTVRRTDVEVEELNRDFQRDFESRYAGRGYTYDQSRAAYTFGQNLAAEPRYRDLDWNTVEPEARQYFEETNPGRWDEFKDAVRYGFERTHQRKAA